MALGLVLAILIDQKIRAEAVLRSIFLYPMALSFIVTGTAWKWLLDPGVGLEKSMHLLGWQGFAFGWIKDGDMAIYCVVIAAVWQTSGFAMALFLAGLRGVDSEQIHAARLDGARTWHADDTGRDPRCGAHGQGQRVENLLAHHPAAIGAGFRIGLRDPGAHGHQVL